MKKSFTNSNVFPSFESEAESLLDHEMCQDIRKTLRNQYKGQKPKSSTVRNLIAFAKVLRVTPTSTIGGVELVIN